MNTPLVRFAALTPWRVTLAWLLGLSLALGLEFVMGPIGLWQPGPNAVGAFAGLGICFVPVCLGLAWCIQALAPRLGAEHSKEERP